MSSDGGLTLRVAKATAAALAVVALAAGIWQVRSVLILLLLARSRPSSRFCPWRSWAFSSAASQSSSPCRSRLRLRHSSTCSCSVTTHPLLNHGARFG